MCFSCRHIRYRLMVAALLLTAAVQIAADDGSAPSALSASIRPAVHLMPEDVVRIQLEALRKNDEDNRGIAVAFRFASPANKRSTGPLPRFISMIKNGPYKLMLDYRHVLYSRVEIDGDAAAQRVTLVGSEGVADFIFFLSRQRTVPCKGCWMTDSVIIVPTVEQAA